MQSVSSRIWTRVAVYISYDDNHYTTGTSYLMLLIIICLHTVIWFQAFLTLIVFKQIYLADTSDDFCGGDAKLSI